MNRAEKRRAKREKNKKVIMTNEQLDRMKYEVAEETFEKILAMLYVLPLQALKEMGWGKIRLQRFNDELTKQLNNTDFKSENIQSLVMKMKQEYGITFRNEGDENA